MIYILVFVICSIAFLFGSAFGIAYLHKKSSLKPGLRFKTKPPKVSSRTVISVSFILPLSVFSLLFLTFPTALLATELIGQGHRIFAILAVFFPSVCFMVGYIYYKRMLKF